MMMGVDASFLELTSTTRSSVRGQGESGTITIELCDVYAYGIVS